MMSFDPFQLMNRVVIAGCGGTGSNIARSAARIVYDLKRRGRHVPELLFVDPDRVEAKNVGRQMFTVADEGHHKAEMLAKRFNFALGLDIRWDNVPLDADKHLSRGAVVVGAVDNFAARAEIARAERVVWIDSGNAVQSGQVVIGNTGEAERVLRNLSGERCHYLPHAGLLFPELLLPPTDDGIVPPVDNDSCAERVEMGEQMLLVNDLMAGVAANYLYKLLHRTPITSFLTYLDAETLTVQSIPITHAELTAYLENSPPTA